MFSKMKKQRINYKILLFLIFLFNFNFFYLFLNRYVMAYSIIMLHTDAHSLKIDKNKKMTK